MKINKKIKKLWVIRVNDKTYKEIKELQVFYEKKIGMYPQITQLVELAIKELKNAQKGKKLSK